MSSTPPVVLVFAASDPTCGAGIQADLLTLASLGCYPVTALTALTIQDTSGIDSIQAIEPDFVERQARLLLKDMPVSAFKIGVLGSAANIARVAEIVADYPNIPLVYDPVLASGRGDALANIDMVNALRTLLLPHTTVLTPNAPEALRLARISDDDADPATDVCAHRLLAMGAHYVLITGTHENTPQVINTLYDKNGPLHRDYRERLPGSYHGSGCTLASALAGYLAQGKTIENAVRDAEQYTWNTLINALHPGTGQLIPNRLFQLYPDQAKKQELP